MTTRLLKHLRDLTKLSQDDLGEIAEVDASYICNTERHGDHLCTPQAQRLSVALGWLGDPALLPADVEDLGDLDALVDLEQLQRTAARGAAMKAKRSGRGRKSSGYRAQKAAVRDGAVA